MYIYIMCIYIYTYIWVNCSKKLATQSFKLSNFLRRQLDYLHCASRNCRILCSMEAPSHMIWDISWVFHPLSLLRTLATMGLKVVSAQTLVKEGHPKTHPKPASERNTTKRRQVWSYCRIHAFRHMHFRFLHIYPLPLPTKLL